MPTSYIVVAGEYSDYHVCGVYSTRKKANYAAKVYDGEVITHKTDALPKHPKGLLGWHVYMRRDGTATASRCAPSQLADDYYKTNRFVNDYIRQGDGPLIAVKQLVTAVWAKDEKHAVKIVNEKRTQIIAANEWPDDPPPPDPNAPRYVTSTSLPPPYDPNPISAPIVAFSQGAA